MYTECTFRIYKELCDQTHLCCQFKQYNTEKIKFTIQFWAIKFILVSRQINVTVSVIVTVSGYGTDSGTFTSNKICQNWRSSRAIMCFFPASKMSTNSKPWNSPSPDDDGSTAAILFILLEKKMTNFGFYFVVYNEKFNDNMVSPP